LDAQQEGEGRRLLGLVELKRGEAAMVALAAAYCFCVMAANSVLKPYRDALGTTVPGLSELWVRTLVACLIVLPPYWALVGRLPRHRFIPWLHRFFELVFVGFYFLLFREKATWFQESAREFYATVSAFNLLVISQFWGFMADLFTRDQGQRLFAWIAAGGSIGGLLGSLATQWALRHWLKDPSGLIFPTIVLLEIASLVVVALVRRVPPSPWRPPPRSDLASRFEDVFAGAKLFVRSPYLLAIAAFMFASLYTNAFAADFQRVSVKLGIAQRTAQAEYYASVNSWQQGIALVGQVVLTSRLVSAVGLGVTLALLPVTGVAGLLAFALRPSLEVVRWFNIVMRGVDYALAKPSREALFTVVSRTEKYQSKSLIDAGLYRAFDALDSTVVDHLRSLGMSAMAWLTVPITASGVVLAALLARMQARRLRVEAPLEPVEEP
jgi:AAA family ATP:ADP antiporter